MFIINGLEYKYSITDGDIMTQCHYITTAKEKNNVFHLNNSNVKSFIGIKIINKTF